MTETPADQHAVDADELPTPPAVDPVPPAPAGSHLGFDMVVVAVSLLYILMWWNRYLSPTVGAELFVAMAHDHGQLPYRDYYSAVPPGFVLWTVGVTAVFGHSLIVFWFLGMLFRVLATWCLFRW